MLRFSAGRYAQEPETYQVQYNAKDNNLAYDLFQAFWQYGYTTPRHNPQVQYSDNYDARRAPVQRHRHVDQGDAVLSVRDQSGLQHLAAVRPDRRPQLAASNGWTASNRSSPKATSPRTDSRFSSRTPTPTPRNDGTNYPGTPINPIDPYNQDIANFNGLTKAGGGSKCYENQHGNVYPDPALRPAQSALQSADLGIRTTGWRRSRCSIATAGTRSVSTSPICRPTY